MKQSFSPLLTALAQSFGSASGALVLVVDAFYRQMAKIE